jgi:ribosome-binding factor A
MSIRTEKLASVIKKDIGEILQRNYQPSGTFITVTQVRMTEDLSIAKIYLSVFSPGRDEGPIYRHIDDNQTEIRYLLASKIKNQVRRIPELLFFQDDTSEYVNRIEKIFSQVKPESREDDNDENKSPSANNND